MRIDEINTRLAAIQAEIDNATGEQLTALETETTNLVAERQQIMDEVQTRQQLRQNIAAGLITGKIIEKKEEENPMENTRTFAVDSAEYREAFLLRLQGKELNAEQRAAVTATAAIPTQTLNQIFRYVEDSPILSRIDMTHIPGNVTLPVESAVADASWIAMAAASTDSADAITPISLGAHKLIKTLEINMGESEARIVQIQQDLQYMVD